MKTRKWLVLGLILGMVGSAHAFDWFGGRLSIGGGYGRAKPELPYAYKDAYQDGEMWTANIKYFVNNDFSIVGSYADLEPYRRGNRQDFYRFRPIMASLRYNIFHHLPVTPYITAGAGYSFNKHEAPGIVADTWEDFAFQAGLGFEFFITEGTSLGVEALYHNFVGQTNVVPYRLATLAGNVNFYFGPGPSTRRSEEALQRQKEALAKAQADADAAKAQAALLAQQNAASQAQATSAQAQAAAAAAAAQAEAERKNQELKAQMAQAQAEINNIKEMVARKDISPINFKTGSAELLAESNATLDKVADTAKKYPQLKLRVEGHTDSTGGKQMNQTLGEKRANSVRDYLVNKAGIPADQVIAAGFGDTRPIDSNDTAQGRAKNRRVEFVFFLP